MVVGPVDPASALAHPRGSPEPPQIWILNQPFLVSSHLDSQRCRKKQRKDGQILECDGAARPIQSSAKALLSFQEHSALLKGIALQHLDFFMHFVQCRFWRSFTSKLLLYADLAGGSRL